MSDGDALLAAILADPDDDAPRLIFADWLDEHAGDVECENCDGTGEVIDPKGPCPNCGGQFEPVDDEYDTGYSPGSGRVSNGNVERAEFIRVQCELARAQKVLPIGTPLENFDGKWSQAKVIPAVLLLSPVPNGRYLELERRASALLNKQGSKFGQPATSKVRHAFRRGFIFSLMDTSEQIIQHLDAILAKHPVEDVTLTTNPEVILVNDGLPPSGLKRAFRLAGRRETFPVADGEDPQLVCLYGIWGDKPGKGRKGVLFHLPPESPWEVRGSNPAVVRFVEDELRRMELPNRTAIPQQLRGFITHRELSEGREFRQVEAGRMVWLHPVDLPSLRAVEYGSDPLEGRIQTCETRLTGRVVGNHPLGGSYECFMGMCPHGIIFHTPVTRWGI